MAAPTAQEVLGERHDVLAPVHCKAGTLEREDAEAIVQVLAEAAGEHVGLEIAVGRRDDAHVDTCACDRRRRARTPDSCKTRNSLGLQIERDVADLVEEQRAAVGELEAARAILEGAGDGAADVAEELALEQLPGDRGAVDLDHRPDAAAELARSWMAVRANSSLPTPDSPRMSTVAPVAATTSMVSRSRLSPGLAPTMRGPLVSSRR